MILIIESIASKAVFRKTLRIMKLTAFLILIACIQVSAYTAAQTVTLSVTNVPVQKILKKISRQTGVSIVYDEMLLRKVPLVTINVKDASIDDVLTLCLKGQSLEFIVDEKIIIIKKKPVLNQTSGIHQKPVPPLEISGTVTDEDGKPIQGVSIVFKGSQVGTITDAQGKFAISIPAKGTLVFSYIGYVSREVELTDQATINVKLLLNQASMHQVVVVGYGTQLRRDVSGSMAVVTEKDFNKGVNQTAADLLQGKVAGLVVTTETGDVTARQTIRLRGTSSLTGSSAPFVVIDGVPGMDLNSVSPQDIESISVLKDAAATAIYGSRSASGVILITTKKGKAGQAQVQFNNYIAIDRVTNKPEVLSAEEWRNYTKENGMDVTGLDLGGNTDWFDEIMRTGISNNHNLSVSGGTDKSNYRASLNYLKREGVMRDNSVKRFNVLFSLNQKALNGRLNLSLTAGAVQSDFSPTNNYNTVLAYTMLPAYTIKNPDGSWFEKFDFEQGNPVHNVEENRNDNKSGQLYGNGNARLKITDGLTVGANFLKQRSTQDASRFNAITTQAGRTDHGYAYRDNQLWDKNLLELISEFEKEWKAHKFKLLGGYSYEENYYQSLSASNRGFISDIFGYNNLTAGERLLPTDVNSYKDLSKLISFFGRLNYSLASKYTLTASLRRDGSSKFGKNNKWGMFPAISGAWMISDESFLSKISFVNDIKLRVGYGVVGNQEGIGPYRSIALYGRGDEYFDNGRWRNTYRYIQNDNPDLKWEETSTINAGIDFGLFNGRISGAIDYYVKKTKDLLYVYNVPVPPNLFPTTLANVGDMSNKGIEVSINIEIVKTKDFTWTSSFNFAKNKNVITRLSDEIYQTASIKTGAINLRGSGNLTSHIVEEGQEVGTFYGWESQGLNDQGQYVFKDQNKDAEINSLDYTYIGRAMPRFTYGIFNSFAYKRFSLSFFFRGVYGNDVLNNPRLQYANVKWLPGSNVLREALTNGIRNDPKFSSYYIEKGSFLRLDNASLSYDIDTRNTLGIRVARVYITGQNLFVLTRFKGLDPEVNMSGLSPGVLESFFVPKSRTFSFGIDLNF
ncbi:MAG: TonB-dependent receptor [Chitinophagaceae bacterium]|nr:TonB-dependent receptor [Chitinophagaceae bacterium]